MWNEIAIYGRESRDPSVFALLLCIIYTYVIHAPLCAARVLQVYASSLYGIILLYLPCIFAHLVVCVCVYMPQASARNNAKCQLCKLQT